MIRAERISKTLRVASTVTTESTTGTGEQIPVTGYGDNSTYRRLLEKKILGEPLDADEAAVYTAERVAILARSQASSSRLRMLQRSMRRSRAKDARLEELSKQYLG